MDFATTIRAYGIAGALGAALLFLVGSSFFLPQLGSNGLCGVLLMCPLGWAAGSLAGAGAALSSQTTIKPRHHLVILRTIVAGLVLLFIPPIVFAIVFVLPNCGL